MVQLGTCQTSFAVGAMVKAQGRTADQVMALLEGNNVDARMAISQGRLVPITLDLAGVTVKAGDTIPVTITANGFAGSTRVSSTTQIMYSALSIPQRTNWYAGDAHIHTTFSDSLLYTPDNRAGTAKSLGLTWMAFSDHVKNLQGLVWSGSYVAEVSRLQAKYSIPIGAGIEVASTSPFGHALGYNLNESAPMAIPDDSLSPSGVISEINRQTASSFSTIAHPYSDFYPWGDWNIASFKAIELMSNQQVVDGVARNKWFQYLNADLNTMAGSPSPVYSLHVGVAGSDCHAFSGPGVLGMTWVWTDSYSPASINTIWDSLKNGHASASGSFDLGVFAAKTSGTLYYVQGNLLTTGTSRTVNFKVVSQPDSGRVCTGYVIMDKRGGVVASASYPPQEDYPSVTITENNFYVVQFTFDSVDGGDVSSVVANPIFVLVR